MKIPILFLLIFFLFNFYCIAQTDSEASLLDKLKNIASDTLKAEVYIDLHNAVFKTDLNKSQEYAKKVLELGKRGGSLRLIQKGYIGLARCERKRRNYEAVFPFDMQSIFNAEQLNNNQNLFSACLLLVRDYLDNDKPSNALPWLNKCKQLILDIENPSYTANFYQTFGYYHYKLNQNKKAIDYYRQSLKIYQSQNDEKMIAELKYVTALSFFAMREPDSVISVLYEALPIYKKRNSIGRQADCYDYLGQCYIMNGNIDKGIKSYLNVIELFELSQDKIQEGLSYIDLARCYLLKKDSVAAEQYGKQAESLMQDMKYEQGIIATKTFWGQYYSEKGESERAETYFREADKMSVLNQLPELKIENDKYWAKHRYKTKNNKGADSLMFSYAKQLVTTHEPSTVNKELAILLKKNPGLDTGTVRILKTLYSPGGAEFLQRSLGKKGLSDISKIENVLNLNPYSLASTAYDSAIIISDNKQMIEQETKYKTRIIADSLKIEKQNIDIAKKDIKQRNIILLAFFSGLLLLTTGMLLQYKNRKRAERDKEKIELLQKEIHHRVKNNLGVIQRLVDVAGKNAVDDVPLSALKTRIKSIELLHTHLYSHEAKPGNISLQAYLEDLCLAIAATFKTEKDIKINVNASQEINSDTAEKLGLIINELVTNSYKYAFNEKNAGVINITAQKDEKNIQIAVEDNGIGFETEKNKSKYGMKLIKGLSHELNGKYFFSNNGGTHFQLSIPV